MRPKCVGVIFWCFAWSWAAAGLQEPAPAQADGSSVLEELTVEARGPRYAARMRRDRIGRVWVPVAINGRGPFRLVVDTGATTSAMVSSVAKRLGLAISPTARVLLQGAAGVDTVPYVIAEQTEVGDLLFNQPKLLIVPDVLGGADGVLGAQQTIGNDRLRKALLLRWRKTQDADVVGVTSDVTQAKSIRIPSIAFDSVRVRNVDISFGELPIFEHASCCLRPSASRASIPR
jgi:hypothetical protein